MDNPAGTKIVRKFFRAKHGRKADANIAWSWYKNYNPKPYGFVVKKQHS